MNYYSAFLAGKYQASFMAKTKEDAERQALEYCIGFDELKGDE